MCLWKVSLFFINKENCGFLWGTENSEGRVSSHTLFRILDWPQKTWILCGFYTSAPIRGAVHKGAGARLPQGRVFGDIDINREPFTKRTPYFRLFPKIYGFFRFFLFFWTRTGTCIWTLRLKFIFVFPLQCNATLFANHMLAFKTTCWSSYPIRAKG